MSLRNKKQTEAFFIAHDYSCWPFGSYLAQCFVALYREAKESSDVVDS